MISFPDYVKSMAGRWMDRPRAVPATPVDAYGIDWTQAPADYDEQPHSTPRPAVTLCDREQVWTAGRWRVIERVVIQRHPTDPAQVLLYLVGGGILGSRFDAVYVSRDEDEIATAAKEACDVG